MENNKNFKLIDNTFSNDEAVYLLLNIFNNKIKFHEKEIFSTNIKYGNEDEINQDRLTELRQTRVELVNFLTDESFKFKKFKVNAIINIEVE